MFWDQVVEALRELILAYAQVCNGNLGYGILIVTFLVRRALLPLTLRLGRAAQAQQAAMQRIPADAGCAAAESQEQPTSPRRGDSPPDGTRGGLADFRRLAAWAPSGTFWCSWRCMPQSARSL